MATLLLDAPSMEDSQVAYMPLASYRCQQETSSGPRRSFVVFAATSAGTVRIRVPTRLVEDDIGPSGEDMDYLRVGETSQRSGLARGWLIFPSAVETVVGPDGNEYIVLLTPETAPDFEGYVNARVLALPGCFSYGHSREEALRNISEAIAAYLDDPDENQD